MKKFLLYSVVFTSFFKVGVACADDIKTNAVKLRAVDKVSGRTTTFVVAVGKKAVFYDMIIEPSVCFKAPPEEPPENKAFLKISEKKIESVQKVFSGWMFSSSPALAAMEHPVYDLWVLECLDIQDNSKEKVLNVNSAESAPERENIEIKPIPSDENNGEVNELNPD